MIDFIVALNEVVDARVKPAHDEKRIRDASVLHSFLTILAERRVTPC
jgi:hypothetical protein